MTVYELDRHSGLDRYIRSMIKSRPEYIFDTDSMIKRSRPKYSFETDDVIESSPEYIFDTVVKNYDERINCKNKMAALVTVTPNRRPPIPNGVRMKTKTSMTTYVLPDENLSLMMLTPKDIEFLRGGGNNISPKDIINLGDLVVLPGISIENMTFGGLLFRVVGRIDQYKGADINSYVLKEVYQTEDGAFHDAYGVSKRNMITMSRSICSMLGIEYENGLELWPMNLNFIRYEDFCSKTPKNRELDYGNMGTYPYNEQTGYVDKICIQISGVTTVNGKLLSPTMNPIKMDSITCWLKLNGAEHLIQYQMISPTEKQENDKIYLELDMSKFHLLPELLEGMNIDDIVTVSWNEMRNMQYIPKAIAVNCPSNTISVETVFDKLDHYMKSVNDNCLKIDDEINRIMEERTNKLNGVLRRF